MPQRTAKLVGAGIPPLSATVTSGDCQDNVTATGTTQATAAPVYGDTTVVTTTAASTGVILSGPQFTSGDDCIVCNLGANALLVYPPLGGQINALAVNAGFSVGAGKSAVFIARADATKFVAGLTA
jgi:hypothetical protein